MGTSLACAALASVSSAEALQKLLSQWGLPCKSKFVLATENLLGRFEGHVLLGIALRTHSPLLMLRSSGSRQP